MQGRRILVVDDHATICTIVGRFIANEGGEVVAVQDGHEGLHAALNGRFDLVIADVEMPNVGGLEMTRCLRHVVKTHAMPIIIISAQDSEKDRDNALEAGANRFIAKPFTKDELLGAVRELLDETSAAETSGETT